MFTLGKSSYSMSRIYFILTLLFSLNSIAQIQSDTATIWMKDSLGFRIHDGYHFGLLSTFQQTKWKRFSLQILNSSEQLMTDSEEKEEHQASFHPSGGLKLNDSTAFLIGIQGTFSYQGMILRTTDYGENWFYFLHPDHNSTINPHALFFLSEDIGIVLFDSDNTEQSIGITYDQGLNWKLNEVTDSRLSIDHKEIKIQAETKQKGDLFRSLTGKYSLNKGKSWINFELSTFP